MASSLSGAVGLAVVGLVVLNLGGPGGPGVEVDPLAAPTASAEPRKPVVGEKKREKHRILLEAGYTASRGAENPWPKLIKVVGYHGIPTGEAAPDLIIENVPMAPSATRKGVYYSRTFLAEEGDVVKTGIAAKNINTVFCYIRQDGDNIVAEKILTSGKVGCAWTVRPW